MPCSKKSSATKEVDLNAKLDLVLAELKNLRDLVETRKRLFPTGEELFGK